MNIIYIHCFDPSVYIIHTTDTVRSMYTLSSVYQTCPLCKKTSNLSLFLVALYQIDKFVYMQMYVCMYVHVAGSVTARSFLINQTSLHSYRWYRNSQPMNFAQSPVLRFPVAAITDGGTYCCRVANDHGSILSKMFTLEVTKAKGRQMHAHCQALTGC